MPNYFFMVMQNGGYQVTSTVFPSGLGVLKVSHDWNAMGPSVVGCEAP